MLFRSESFEKAHQNEKEINDAPLHVHVGSSVGRRNVYTRVFMSIFVRKSMCDR